jgi:LPXTG-site transpeptidase (sortase) family protein
VAQNTSRKRSIVFISLVTLVVLGMAGFIAYDFWVMDQKSEAIPGAPGVVRVDEKNAEKASEGSETTHVTSDDLSTYKVAADAPRIITVDKLDIAARIRPMGLHSDKSIQAPKNINDAGWYNGSVKPGQTGAVFIDGHASGSTRKGLFAYLDTMNTGDTLQVEKGDGTRLTYRVIFREVVALNDIDMKKVLLPYGNTLKALNLMTCTGTWLPDKKTYDQRVVVYTEQV